MVEQVLGRHERSSYSQLTIGHLLRCVAHQPAAGAAGSVPRPSGSGQGSMSTQGVAEDNQLLDSQVADNHRARRGRRVRRLRLATVRDRCANQSHPLGCCRRFRGRGRRAQSPVVDHPQACGCQGVTPEHAAVVKARKRRVCLAHAFSRCALHPTWRTIENLEPYAIGRITPDRSLTVAVLNRRQAPPVDNDAAQHVTNR